MSDNTWQTELLKELRTQPKTPQLDELITRLETSECNFELIANELHTMGLGYFGNKTLEMYYHERAQSENRIAEEQEQTEKPSI